MGGFMAMIKKERDEGKLEGKLETAKKMLKEGVDTAFISKITDLPLEKIKELLTELNL
jgi:predicted transposase/invertase (TIGR01784 family)